MAKLKDHSDNFQPPKISELIKYIYGVLRPRQGRNLTLSVAFFLLALIALASKLLLYAEFTTVDAILSVFALASLTFSMWNLSQHLLKDKDLVIETDPKAANLVLQIRGSEHVPGTSMETIYRDKELDIWLQIQPNIKMIVSQEIHHALRTTISANADPLEKLLRSNYWRSARNHKQFSDDPKICLADDITVGLKSCRIFIGTYFDSYCTNEFCTKLLRTKDTRAKQITSGLGLFPATDKTLKPIATSLMNNHIGISTLAITSDGFVCLWRQGDGNQIAEGKVVATGSGSLDDDDLTPSLDLIDTLRTGMARELREESSEQGQQFNSDPVLETRITGYFRWVKRGGKPEFVGISRLRIPKSELNPNNSEVEAPEFAGLEFPARSWKELRQSLRDTLENYNHYSPSCWVALECLHDLAKSEPQEWENFLFGPTIDVSHKDHSQISR